MVFSLLFVFSLAGKPCIIARLSVFYEKKFRSESTINIDFLKIKQYFFIFMLVY